MSQDSPEIISPAARELNAYIHARFQMLRRARNLVIGRPFHLGENMFIFNDDGVILIYTTGGSSVLTSQIRPDGTGYVANMDEDYCRSRIIPLLESAMVLEDLADI